MSFRKEMYGNVYILTEPTSNTARGWFSQNRNGGKIKNVHGGMHPTRPEASHGGRFAAIRAVVPRVSTYRVRPQRQTPRCGRQPPAFIVIKKATWPQTLDAVRAVRADRGIQCTYVSESMVHTPAPTGWRPAPSPHTARRGLHSGGTEPPRTPTARAAQGHDRSDRCG